MALSCISEFKGDGFADGLVNQPPRLLGAVAKSMADVKKPYSVIKLEEDIERPIETTDEAVSEEEPTPMCAGSVTSTPSSHPSWHDVMPMKVPISPSRWKEIAAQCLLSPMHATTAPKSSQIMDATNKQCVRAPPGLETMFPQSLETPKTSSSQCSQCSLSSSEQEKPYEAVRHRGGGSNLGLFLRRFVFTGFDAVNHADFDLVPRLIGRGGCNMSAIREACNAYIRVNKGASIKKPVEVVLRCENQEDFDEGINRVTKLLEGVRVHFTRFCRKRGISPVPELYHILS